MNRNSFGEWFIIMCALVSLIMILMHIGSIDESVQKLNEMKLMYHKSISLYGYL